MTVNGVGPAADPTVETHLMPVAGRPWSFWRLVLLRSAGFPADLPLRLGAQQAASAVDRLLAAEAVRDEALDEALAAVNRALDELRAAGCWDDDQRRKPLLKLQRWLSRGKLTEKAARVAAEQEAPVAEAAERFARRRAVAEQAAREMEEAYRGALAEQSATLTELVSRPRFQEAVLWQNRAAFRTGISRLADSKDGDRDSQRRQHEELAASYLQRYCLKNDTIGFFGPLAWGWFSDEGPALEVRPGSRLIAERRAFFEEWGVDAVARQLARDPAVRRWLRPRRPPHVMLHGPMVILPGREPTPLPPAEAALLAACDGTRPAREITAELSGGDEPAFADAAEAEAALARFVERGWVAWDFEVPMGPQAEEALARQVEAIGDEDARQRGETVVEELARHRRRITAAAGDPESLDRELAALEAAFTEATGEAATRRAGGNYSGRTLIYEESLRDVELEVGPALREALEAPLSLVLASARWYLERTTDHLRRLFTGVFDRMVEGGAGPVVESGHFWREIEPYLFGDRQGELTALLPELHRRWEEVLGVEEGRRRLDLSAAELEPRVREAFATSAPDLPFARYCCPDVMIAADGPDAVEAGDYQIVLGEFHPGRLTFNNWVFLTLCPVRDEVFRWIDRDIPEPAVIPLPPKDNPIISTRTHKAHLSQKDYFIPPLDGSVVVPPERAISLADMVLEREGDEVVLRSRDGRLRFGIFEFFIEFVALRLVNAFGLLGPRRHRPRITVDRVVLRRESWSLPVGELEFAHVQDGAERFAAARRWARGLGLPRFLFARTPNELKPFYVDLDSPIYVDLLAKAVRASADRPEASVSLSEMLPDPHQLWLEDAEGRRYTSELRMIMKTDS